MITRFTRCTPCSETGTATAWHERTENHRYSNLLPKINCHFVYNPRELTFCATFHRALQDSVPAWKLCSLQQEQHEIVSSTEFSKLSTSENLPRRNFLNLARRVLSCTLSLAQPPTALHFCQLLNKELLNRFWICPKSNQADSVDPEKEWGKWESVVTVEFENSNGKRHGTCA